MTPEFSRLIDVRQTGGKSMKIEAEEAERAALAKRFGIVRIDRLRADLELSRKNHEVEVCGRMVADLVQPCAVTTEELPVSIDEPVYVRFVPERTDYAPDEELELDAEDCDEIEYGGSHIDVGEAVAQSLALAIDPFLTGPNADAARKAAGIGTPEEHGAFAALKGLKLGK